MEIEILRQAGKVALDPTIGLVPTNPWNASLENIQNRRIHKEHLPVLPIRVMVHAEASACLLQLGC